MHTELSDHYKERQRLHLKFLLPKCAALITFDFHMVQQLLSLCTHHPQYDPFLVLPHVRHRGLEKCHSLSCVHRKMIIRAEIIKGEKPRYRFDLSCTWGTNCNQCLLLHTIYYNMIRLAHEGSKTDPWQWPVFFTHHLSDTIRFPTCKASVIPY